MSTHTLVRNACMYAHTDLQRGSEGVERLVRWAISD